MKITLSLAGRMWNTILLFLIVLEFGNFAYGQEFTPKLAWDFSRIENRSAIELKSGIVDTLEGYFKSAPGIHGNGLRLDGFTTRLIHSGRNLQAPGDELTVEAWIALANYPWNWCPVITSETIETRGYCLMAGPHGEISFQVAIGEQWISCTTERLKIPLREWKHITGVYRANQDLALYVNGEMKAVMPIQGRMGYARNCNIQIGMVAHPEKPSDIHRTWGTLPQYFGLTGIVDEIRVYYEAMTAVTAEVSIALVIGHDKDDVGTGCPSC
jgi:hypothetical protein